MRWFGYALAAASIALPQFVAPEAMAWSLSAIEGARSYQITCGGPPAPLIEMHASSRDEPRRGRSRSPRGQSERDRRGTEPEASSYLRTELVACDGASAHLVVRVCGPTPSTRVTVDDAVVHHHVQAAPAHGLTRVYRLRELPPRVRIVVEADDDGDPQVSARREVSGPPASCPARIDWHPCGAQPR